jgi:hypothetical protein
MLNVSFMPRSALHFFAAEPFAVPVNAHRSMRRRAYFAVDVVKSTGAVARWAARVVTIAQPLRRSRSD